MHVILTLGAEENKKIFFYFYFWKSSSSSPPKNGRVFSLTAGNPPLTRAGALSLRKNFSLTNGGRGTRPGGGWGDGFLGKIDDEHLLRSRWGARISCIFAKVHIPYRSGEDELGQRPGRRIRSKFGDPAPGGRSGGKKVSGVEKRN